MGNGENEWSEMMLKPELTEHPDGTNEWWLDSKPWDANKQPRNKAGQVWWVMAKMSGAK